MKRRHELTRHRRRIFRCVPARNVWQHEFEIRDSRCNGQVARVANATAIRVGRPLVVVDLLSDGGGSLKTCKKDQ